MAKNVSELSVFVASPGDVSEEREALEEVIRELNIIWRGLKAVRLELVRWETHAYPSVGTDAQAVINEQIGDDYDIFIGILSGRFGTPTERAESGTEEEFNRAYERYRGCPDALRILLYFKDAQVKLSEVDLDQLAKVRAFKGKVGDKGSLYWEYKDKDEFCRLVRIHLSRHVDDWGKKWATKATLIEAETAVTEVPQAEVAPAAELEEPEEEGFLDLIESGTENMLHLTEIMHRMEVSVNALGEKIQKRTEELSQAQLGGQAPDMKSVKAVKRICNHAADDLLQFTRVFDAELPLFAETLGKGIDAYSKAAAVMPDFAAQGEDVSEAATDSKQTLINFKEAVVSSLNSVLEFRTAIAAHPRMTTKYNRAKRKAVGTLDQLAEEMRSALNQIEESEKSFDALLQDEDDSEAEQAV